VTEAEWNIVEDLNLIERFDFFWDINRMIRWLW